MHSWSQGLALPINEHQGLKTLSRQGRVSMWYDFHPTSSLYCQHTIRFCKPQHPGVFRTSMVGVSVYRAGGRLHFDKGRSPCGTPSGSVPTHIRTHYHTAVLDGFLTALLISLAHPTRHQVILVVIGHFFQ